MVFAPQIHWPTQHRLTSADGLSTGEPTSGDPTSGDPISVLPSSGDRFGDAPSGLATSKLASKNCTSTFAVSGLQMSRAAVSGFTSSGEPISAFAASGVFLAPTEDSQLDNKAEPSRATAMQRRRRHGLLTVLPPTALGQKDVHPRIRAPAQGGGSNAPFRAVRTALRPPSSTSSFHGSRICFILVPHGQASPPSPRVRRSSTSGRRPRAGLGRERLLLA